MNKLVSRNLVLRFKLGRKILKAYLGEKFVRKIEKIWDTPIQVLLTPGTAGSYAAFGYNMPKTQSTIGDLANLLAMTVTAPAIMGTAGRLATGKAASNANKIVLTGLKLISGTAQKALPGKVSTSNVPAVIGKQIGFSTPLSALTTGLKVWRGIGGTTLLAFPFISSITNSSNSSLKINTLNSPDYSWMKGGTRLRTPEELKKWEAEVLRLKNLQNIVNTKKNTPTNTRVTQKKNWDDEFTNNFLNNLTTELKAYLTNAGIDYNKVGDVLSYLMNLLNTNLGGYGADNKWGRNSINAWNQFVSKTDFTPKVLAPVSPLPISFNTTPSTPQIPNLNANKIYNRSDIRNLIRERTGKSAYNFNGALRKALRMVMNGTATDDDKSLVQGMGIFKQGGNLLPSKNIIERFKLRKFK